MKPGIFLVIVFLFFNCSEENEDTISPTSEFYFLGKVDNRQILIEEKDDIEFVGGRSHYSADGQNCAGGYKTGLYKISDSGIRLTLQITFYNVAHSIQPCNETDINEIFFSELNAGDYQLSFIKDGITTVGIHYYDENNIAWNSIYKEQNDQSFFTVEKTEFLGTDESGKRLQKVEGKFASYLYQYDFETETIKDSIFVSNAEFVFRFISE